LFVDATGRVGLNTAAPDSILHISSSAPRLTFTDTDTGADHRINADSGAGNLAIDVDFNSDTASPALVANIKGTERLRIDSSGRLLVGTSSDSGGALFQVNGDRIRVGTAKTPATSGATGTTGEIAWDADYIYVCTATNTWKRTAISTW
jgi:hypothetical protein